jgi:hypothetical protein
VWKGTTSVVPPSLPWLSFRGTSVPRNLLPMHRDRLAPFCQTRAEILISNLQTSPTLSSRAKPRACPERTPSANEAESNGDLVFADIVTDPNNPVPTNPIAIWKARSTEFPREERRKHLRDVLAPALPQRTKKDGHLKSKFGGESVGYPFTHLPGRVRHSPTEQSSPSARNTICLLLE